MTKLTKRETSLLIALFSAIIIVVGVMYVVLPMKDNVDVLTQDRDTLIIQKLDMETKIAQTTQLISNKEALIRDVSILMNNMSDPLMGENFDIQVQNLAQLRGMKVKSVKYGGVETTKPSAIGTPVQQYEYNLKQLVDTYTGYTGDATESYVTEHELLKQTITLQVDGTYLATQRLLSDLNNVGQTYYVKSVTYTRTSSSETIEDTDQTIEKVTETATIVVDVYFVEVDRSTEGWESSDQKR